MTPSFHSFKATVGVRASGELHGLHQSERLPLICAAADESGLRRLHRKRARRAALGTRSAREDRRSLWRRETRGLPA